MNGITGASTQTGSAAPAPYNPADVTDLKATGFAFKDGGLSWDQWIDAARTSLDPQIRAQFQELVDLAGGRTHDAAIMDVMARVAAMQQAAQPGATASDRQAALNAMGDQLTTMLRGMDVAGQLSGPLDDAARVLATMPEFANTEWGQALGAVFSSPRAYAAYQIGQVKGVFEGGKEMVTGIISLAAKTIQYGVDNSMLGDAGDIARGLTGKMPGWLDEVIPSSQRGEASTAALDAMGKGIHNYLTTHTRGEVARDLGNALNNAWEGVKADHAAARAQGPEAEAEFLGRMTGRIGFEIAATFAGGAGIAGKAAKVGKVADVVSDGARAADKVAEGARVADKAADGGRAIGDGAKIAERGADGAQAINRAENVVASGAKQTAAITGTRAATSSIAIAAASKADDAAKLADVATDGARVAENAADSGKVAKPIADDLATTSKEKPNVGEIHTKRGRFGKNIVEWTVDAQGRLISAKATLQEVFKGLQRSKAEVDAQIATGEKGLTTDHGGHAIPHRFLGDQGSINMFPQNGVPMDGLKNFNGSAFKTLENELADWVKAGGKVEYEVKFSDFDPKHPERPNRVVVEYVVRNSDGSVVHDRKRIFTNKAGQIYNRVSISEIKSILAKNP